jgi:hypothetical protein
MDVCCECCVLSGRGLCDGLITRPEESYRVWSVWVWSWSLDNEEAQAHIGLSSHRKKKIAQAQNLIPDMIRFLVVNLSVSRNCWNNTSN